MYYLSALHAKKLTFFSVLAGAAFSSVGIGLTLQLAIPHLAILYNAAYISGLVSGAFSVVELRDSDSILEALAR